MLTFFYSAITWSGFDNFTYLYTYEETDKIFECAGDLDIFKHVFHLDHSHGPAAVATATTKQIRPEYNLVNKYFVALSFAELVEAVEDESERETLRMEVESVKKSYGSLAEAYRRNMGLEEAMN